MALLAACILASGCGARLTSAQVSALNPPPVVIGGSTGSAAANSGASGGGTPAAALPTASTPGSVSGGRSSGPVAAPQGAPATGPASAAASTVAGLGVSSSVCNGPAAGPGVSPSEVDVGTVTTLTGPVPGLFAGAVRGINAFAAYLNSVGGVCGRKLVVKAADDNLQASQNATAAQSLVNSVLAFVGSLSGVDEGGAPVLQSSGVPDVGEALSTQRFNLSNNFSPMPQGISVDLAPWVYFKQKYPQVVTHMAVLSVNQATDLAETQAAVQGLESIGYKFVYTDYNVELDQTDFSADAQAMKAAGAQGLVFIAIASLYALVAKAMQNAGLHMALPDYDQNAYDPNFIPDAGSAADGAILWSEVALYQGEDAASVPTIALFDKWYKAVSGGGSPDLYAAWGWMSGMLFVAGLNAGAGLSRTALMDGLRTVTSFDAGGIESPADPPTKRPPDCYLVVDVVNQRFVRDPVNPTSGFDCTGAPNHYFPH